MQLAKTSQGRFMFNVDEWLTTSQVRSYFSRMRLTAMKKTDQLSSFGATQHTTIVDNDNEEQQESDEGANAEESFKDDVALQEAIERITLTRETNQIPERSAKEKRPLSSIQNEITTPKRSTTPQNRKD
ncbi:unnamed protein product [Rotaria sp. Silwood1]|nr:unnamed protein product [Rotaria sp. Silwood1]CAF5028957.1 unnamed protein product [Rotaria sp. Silwood1]CAF5107377.1 unnamed protein product [Rotaria sp. Silwood1]